MNWKYFLTASLALGLGTSLFAMEEVEDPEIEDVTKTCLSVTGDVRTELQIKKKKPELDVELNLELGYTTDKTFSLIKFKFDNDMGIDGATFDRVSLSKALVGLNLLDLEEHNVNVIVGRQPFSDAFHSKAQFNSSFDGAHIKYDFLTPIGEAYIKQGGFVINDKLKKIGSATEIGLDKINETGAYMKGSFAHWNPEHQVVQLSVGYKGFHPTLEQVVHLYAAGLMNVKNQKNGYYAGLTVGERKEKGDYYLDINYQWLEKKAVHKKDASGLGVNKKGIAGELCYNLTDKVSLYKSVKWKKDIVKTEKSSDDWIYEIELRHSF